MESGHLAAADAMAELQAWKAGRSKACLAWAPGRVNLIGDHTDYNGGLVLPRTLDAVARVAARPASGSVHRIASLNYGSEVSFAPGEMPPAEAPSWSAYVGGMLREFCLRESFDMPLEMSIGGSVPIGAGLSSSAALEMAVALAVAALAGLDLDPVDAARLGQYVEHTYAGVQCGIMDQLVSIAGKARHALFLDCRSMKYRHVPLGKAAFVVLDSGVKRQLATSAYNERRRQCKEALARSRERFPALAAVRNVVPAMLDPLAAVLPELLSSRLRHVVEENERVGLAAAALEAGDLQGLGGHMYASHKSLRDLYEVSCRELDFLVETARKAPGCRGARMTGGGFGGCTVNLVDCGYQSDFVAHVEAAYVREFGRSLAAIAVRDGRQAGTVVV